MDKIKNLSKFADKKFGQNFLKNNQIIKQIIQAIPNDKLEIVEIGSGLGDLTKELINVRNVTAFEVDKRLCEHLYKTFDEPIAQGLLDLKCKDVLEHWGDKSLLDRDYHLIANLPYYIATNIILKALKDKRCQSILVMVQKEVAEKFVANSGDRAFSALSVLTQTAGEGELLFDVEPHNFVPPPKVVSSILLINKKESLNDRGFEEFLKVAFKQPRKTLFKNLSSKYSKDKIKALFLELDIKNNLRPHEVTTPIYHHLYNELKDNLDGKQQTKQRKLSKSRARNSQQ